MNLCRIGETKEDGVCSKENYLVVVCGDVTSISRPGVLHYFTTATASKQTHHMSD